MLLAMVREDGSATRNDRDPRATAIGFTAETVH
jgi:hypothetical protein